MLSNFYRDIIYISIKPAVCDDSIERKTTRLISWRSLYRVISENAPWRGNPSVVSCVLKLSWRTYWNFEGNMWLKKEISQLFICCFTHETNDRRRSSLLLLATARSFRKWDMRSWKFIGHEDTVLIKKFQKPTYASTCVHLYARVCLDTRLKHVVRVNVGTIGSDYRCWSCNSLIEALFGEMCARRTVSQCH